MKHLVPLLALLLIAADLAFAQEYVPGEVIVRMKNADPASSGGGLSAKTAGSKGFRLKAQWNGMNMAHFTVSKGQTVESAIAELQQDPNVLYAEPNYIYRISGDTGLQQTFSSDEVHATAATSAGNGMATGAAIDLQQTWSRPVTGADRPVVAILDTGLDVQHPVFVNSQSIWQNGREIAGNGIDDDGNGYVDDVNGWDFVTNSGALSDTEGHGTHVAGIVLSVDQNIFASSLQRSRIRLMPLRFMDSNGVGSTSNAIKAIYYAVNNGASVINNSWGGNSYSSALNEAIAYSYSKGVAVISAAGNSGTNNDAAPVYPANYDVPNVISVAATTDKDTLATFSNFGANSVHLGSPGVLILSTLPGGKFGTMSGTSMATPFVAGTAAQMKVDSPQMLGYQLKKILLTHGNSADALTGRVTTAARLNANAAVSFARTASLEAQQPAYAFDYQADRNLASAGASGGCGKSVQNGTVPFGSVAAVVGLLLAQLVGLILWRWQAARAARSKHP